MCVCVCVYVLSGLGTRLSRGPSSSIFWPNDSGSCRGSGSGAGQSLACLCLHIALGTGCMGSSGQGHFLGILLELLVYGLELYDLVLPT